MLLNFDINADSYRVWKDADGNRYVTAIISDNKPDKANERVSEAALEDFVSYVKTKSIPLLPSHRESFEIGLSSDARTIKKGDAVQLEMDFKLIDGDERADRLYKEIDDGECKRQLSIGVFVDHRERNSVYFEVNKQGRRIRVLNKMQPDHVAVTRENHACNPRTKFTDAVMKALDEAGIIASDLPSELPENEQNPIIIKDAEQALFFGRELKYTGEGQRLKQSQGEWVKVYIDALHKGMIPKEAEKHAFRVIEKLSRTIDTNPLTIRVEKRDTEGVEIGILDGGGHSHQYIVEYGNEKSLRSFVLTTKNHCHKINIGSGRTDVVNNHSHTIKIQENKMTEKGFMPKEDEALIEIRFPADEFSSEESVKEWLTNQGMIRPQRIRTERSGFRPDDTVAYSYTAEFDTKDKDYTNTRVDMIGFNIYALIGYNSSSQSRELGVLMGDNKAEIEKAAVPYRDYPMSDETGWSFTAADGNELLGENGDNWGRYKEAHAYFDREQGTVPTVKQAYGLPHHKNVPLRTYRRGVTAAIAALNGARGGFQRAQGEERTRIYNHLARHLRENDIEPPELQEKWMDSSLSDEELSKILENSRQEMIAVLTEKGYDTEWLSKDWWFTWDESVAGNPENIRKGVWIMGNENENTAVEKQAEKEPETKEPEQKAEKEEEKATEEKSSEEKGESQESTEQKEQDEKARGEGQGVGGPRQGDGGTDTCVCKSCGHEMPHERGTPCSEIKCPECGGEMMGKEDPEKPDEKSDEKPDEKSDEKTEEKSDDSKESEKDDAEKDDSKKDDSKKDDPVDTIDKSIFNGELTDDQRNSIREIFSAHYVLSDKVVNPENAEENAESAEKETATDESDAENKEENEEPTMADVIKRLDALEKGISELRENVNKELEAVQTVAIDKSTDASNQVQERVEKAFGAAFDKAEEILAEKMNGLNERIETLEKSGAASKQPDGQEDPDAPPAKAGSFKGIFSNALKNR